MLVPDMGKDRSKSTRHGWTTLGAPNHAGSGLKLLT